MYENDYAIEHHFKACLTKEQVDRLWTTGHCHSDTTGLPFVAPDGLLFCGPVGVCENYDGLCLDWRFHGRQ
jgi:hypothetical protein